ncbi:unnamed protein product [Urochloa humidicola]
MACLTSAAALKFTVRRQPAVLVVPTAPTPRELKRLSDIDNQDALRFYVPIIQFYRRSASMDGQDPARVVRDAVARALVHYYPLAGRLRELEGRKLAVDCTGEGVPFVEADADVRLEQFGDAVCPPAPCVEELFFDVHRSLDTLNSPLLLFQVTRLACGGFVLATRIQQAMADEQGMSQLLGAVTELARGAAAPSVQPVWARELLEARKPPRAPRFPHRRKYDEVPAEPGTIVPLEPTVLRSFFFGPREVAAIQAQLPAHLRKHSTTFEVLAAFLWRCRTMALAPYAGEEMRLIFPVSARGGRAQDAGLRIPRGYYGNSVALLAAVSTAGDLRANPVGFAVELVRKAKGTVDVEYLWSVADLMALGGWPHFTAARSAFLLSDMTKVGFGDLDFGWGRAVYGGPATVGAGGVPGLGLVGSLVRYTTARGEDGILALMCLPGPAMDRFVEEMAKLSRALPLDITGAARRRAAL